MSSTITASFAGQDMTVDMALISGWDAIEFRATFGTNLEDVVAAMSAPDALLGVADLTVVAWLWYRQTTSPDVSVREVARRVSLFPDADEPAEPEAG